LKYPKTFYYNSDWSDDPSLPTAKEIFDKFVFQLETFLGVKRIEVDVEDAWTKDNPMGTGRTFEEEFLRVS
jgi:hypothetical protein